MTSTTTASSRPAGGPPKRSWRNYLLDARFQLKYTGMVVVVTLVVAGVLGGFAYEMSTAQTQMLSLDGLERGQTVEYIEQQAAETDRRIAMSILGGIATLTMALGITGILVTHRLVGPAYKLKSLFRHVSAGHLALRGRLRRGDELQDVFADFERMIESLRSRRRSDLEALEAAIAKAESSDLVGLAGDLRALRDRLAAELDG